ncbi:hypothetical protein LAZ67_13001558, partial [Cordylochernes scorpioides]
MASNTDLQPEQIFLGSSQGLSPPSARFPTPTQYTIRQSVTQVLPKPAPQLNLSLGKYRSLRSLRQNPHIIVTRSDKGSQTVILDTDDYITKMMDILNDQTTFMPITRLDLTSSTRTFRLKLLRLKKSGSITAEQYHIFTSDISNTPYIYGLPKIHKPTVPLRPIIAYHLSPAYKLSKYLSSYLTPLVKTRPQSYSITDIPAFIQFIQSLTPIQNSTMVSYDVNSMYLSLPHQLIISQLTKFLQDAQLESDTVATIVALTSICLNTTDFTFNNLFYKQIRGSPMGSPLSSPLAEIVMSTLDTWIQQQFTPGIHIWRRYIDDILCICETGQENSILSVLNSFHPDISFSFESEANNAEETQRFLNRQSPTWSPWRRKWELEDLKDPHRCKVETLFSLHQPVDSELSQPAMGATLPAELREKFGFLFFEGSRSGTLGMVHSFCLQQAGWFTWGQIIFQSTR